MKQKGIKRLILCLIPLMIAFFSLSIFTATYKPAVADTPTYPFKTGVNAFENGRLFTVPTEVTGDWSEIYYKYEGAKVENSNCFPSLSIDGYLAFQIATDKPVGIYFKAYSRIQNILPMYSGIVYFMYENGSVITLSDSGLGPVIPAGARGTVILSVNGFQGGIDYSLIEFFTLNIHDAYGGANVKIGALGYYQSSTATEIAILSAASVNTSWVITLQGAELPNINAVSEKTIYTMRTGDNAFAYGKQWTNAESATGFSILWAKSRLTTFALDVEKGYLAWQIETLTDTALYIQIVDTSAPVAFVGTSYFVDESGAIDVCFYNDNTKHIEIPAGKKGMLILPVSGFALAGFNYSSVSMFVPNVNTDVYKNVSIKIGELGYFASSTTTQMQKIIELVDASYSWQYDSHNGVGTVTAINFVEDKIQYDMRTGSKAFEYGKTWTGVQETYTEWPQAILAFDDEDYTVSEWNDPVYDKGYVLDNANGYIALQMETDKTMALAIMLFDGSVTESLIADKPAYFINEQGETTSYTVLGGGVVQLEGANRGVLLLPLNTFTTTNGMNWDSVTAVSITLDLRYNFGFNFTMGEIGYYETNESDMVKLLTLNKPLDSKKIAVYDDRGTTDVVQDGIKFVSISTAGDLGLIFYVAIAKLPTAQITGVFTVDGVDGATEFTGVYHASTGCFAFIASVLPNDYDKDVTLTIGEQVMGKYSVAKYLELLADSSSNDKLKALGVAIETYCKAVQAYVSDSVTVEEKVSFDADLGGFAHEIINDDNDNVLITKFSMTLESRNNINVYFDSTLELDQITHSDNVTVKNVGENKYVAIIKNISAKNLDNELEITIGNDTMKLSAISYVKTAIEETDNAEVYNVAVAIYNYNLAANAYFGN